MLSKVYRFFFRREILGTYLPLLRKKNPFFFFNSSGKKKEKKIRTLKNATTKKERKRTKKEIRFSFSIPKFICTFEKNDLSFLKWPVSEKIASEQPNFDTQIHWQVFIKNYIIWVSRFFPFPRGRKRRKKTEPWKPFKFFLHFFLHFFFLRTKKKNGAIFLPTFFFESKQRNKNLVGKKTV